MTAVQSLDSRESPGSVVRRYGSVGIAAAASVSDAFIVDRAQTVFIQTPSGWDAAAVSLQGSIDGSTYAALNSLAGEVSSTAITGAKVVGPYNVEIGRAHV